MFSVGTNSYKFFSIHIVIVPTLMLRRKNEIISFYIYIVAHAPRPTGVDLLFHAINSDLL